ncbi:hypothetical protein ACHHRT_02895 [Desulfurivibrio sp. D14AmB]
MNLCKKLIHCSFDCIFIVVVDFSVVYENDDLLVVNKPAPLAALIA